MYTFDRLHLNINVCLIWKREVQSIIENVLELG
jgi:hypothetical protein